MPRHPPNALTSRLKTRTTNDITVADHARPSNDHSVSIVLPKAGGTIPTASFKISIHNVKHHRGSKAAGQTGFLILDAIANPRWLCVQVRRAVGGAYRDRTDDLKLAKLALSQLS
jgi:hypothetical protein